MRKLAVGAAVLLLLAAMILWDLRPTDREQGEAPPRVAVQVTAADILKQGRELVTLGDCRACHTSRGGKAYAGGREIPTPFGTFFSPNITSDLETGIGGWSAEDFWHALHNGYSRNGTLLYPTFPYTNYTRVTRRDADAMYAYLKTVPPVRQINRGHDLRFPYNQRLLLSAWRWLFFRPGVYTANARRTAEWNRGAYLTEGLGHCSACHEARNALGAIGSRSGPRGGLVLNWYAPALTSTHEAGLRDWKEEDIVRLLQIGRVGENPLASVHASTMGPMGEVVYESLQHVDPTELRAMAVYLMSLPQIEAAEPESYGSGSAGDSIDSGRRLYAQHCARCHGDHGEGRLPAGPPLDGNRAVAMYSAVNPIRIVLYGGYPPGTQGNPRPYGMPPFFVTLDSLQIANVLSYVRGAWGNHARAVSGAEIEENRGGPLW